MEMPQEQHREKPQLAQLCGYLYMIYTVSMLMQGYPLTMMLGMAALIIALIITYAKRKAVAGTWLESHYSWLIRTFWIGGSVYLPAATVIATCIIWPNLRMQEMTDAVLAGQITNTPQMMDYLMEKHRTLLWTVMLGLFGPFVAWWIYRCWHGYRLLLAAKPVPNVKSWF